MPHAIHLLPLGGPVAVSTPMLPREALVGPLVEALSTRQVPRQFVFIYRMHELGREVMPSLVVVHL
jgi:hypothetical protein